MKFVALISGGKDSLTCALEAVAHGHELVAIANLHPKVIEELDSYMYQTVGVEIVPHIAEALEVPIIRQEITGTSKAIDMIYTPTEGDEVEDLEILLRKVKDEYPDVQGISSGAIFSNY